MAAADGLVVTMVASAAIDDDDVDADDGVASKDAVAATVFTIVVVVWVMGSVLG